MAPAPVPLTEAEISMHALTHLPHRRWNSEQLEYTFIVDVGETMLLKYLAKADMRRSGIMRSVITKRGIELFIERLIISTLKEWGLQDNSIEQGYAEPSLIQISHRVAETMQSLTSWKSNPGANLRWMGIYMLWGRLWIWRRLVLQVHDFLCC